MHLGLVHFGHFTEVMVRSETEPSGLVKDCVSSEAVVPCLIVVIAEQPVVVSSFVQTPSTSYLALNLLQDDRMAWFDYFYSRCKTNRLNLVHLLWDPQRSTHLLLHS